MLIIDEIHLLNDERGPILECLVARTLLGIQRIQTQIRLKFFKSLFYYNNLIDW